MKRLVVKINTYGEGKEYVNIEADYMKPDGNQVYVLNEENEVVGIFEKGTFYAMYFSNKDDDR